MAKTNFQIEGMDELIKSMKKLGKIPQKHVTSASKKGMNISLKDAKANAPYETGDLKKGIKIVGEKSSSKGKKIYRTVFDRSMNDVFQKKNSAGKIIGYYPVSQEYGYFTKNGKYIPGFKFISNSLTENTGKIEETIISTLKKKIDAEIVKEGLK
jgi:HK97 gp10 family phage protein